MRKKDAAASEREALLVSTPRASVDSKDGGETRPRLSTGIDEGSWAKVGPTAGGGVGGSGAAFTVGEDDADDEMHL